MPAIVNPGPLRSLASARSTEDKCDVLLAWIESSRMDGPANSRFVMPAQMLTVFRDEPMTAVFGMTYDRTENRWRIEEYQKVISHCLGIARPQARAPYGIGRPNLNAERQYSAQFSQYRQVLDQAFLGSPGPDEPTAIVRYLQQIREQLAWAASAMSAAASGAPTKETFDRIRTDAQSANGKLPLLSASEKKRVTDYLTKREADLAPAIVDGWFREASSLPRTRASASQLLTSHNSIAPVLTALDGSARNEWERKYKELIDSMIADSVAAQTAKLREIPTTLAGLPQLVSWRTAFTSEFGEFGGSPLVSAALEQYGEAQSRVARGAFPAWLQQAQKVPVDGEAITAKRRELDAYFPARADRASPLLAEYEAPLKAKED